MGYLVLGNALTACMLQASIYPIGSQGGKDQAAHAMGSSACNVLIGLNGLLCCALPAKQLRARQAQLR